MPLTNAGRDAMVADIIGESVTEFNNANAYIGVGDSSAAFAAGQTDLQAATNKFRKGMDATFPTRAGNVLTFKATFGTSEANFAWNEYGIFNAANGGTMLTRKVESLGTKLNTQQWQFTVQLTINVA
jgi:hypothetical protein